MNNPQASIEHRISDSPSSRFWQELFRNPGFLVEGLLDGQKVRFYDVIVDAVNTASRIEKISSAGEQKEVAVKGKDQPIKVYLIQ